MTKNNHEADPLLVAAAAPSAAPLYSSDDYVIPTSTGGKVPEKTVGALLRSRNPKQIGEAMAFMRRVLAMLVFQYSAILVVASPFALMESFQDNVVHPHYHTWFITSLVCMIASVLLAITKGNVHPYPRITLVCLILSVAVQLGLTFEEKSWGDYGLAALGQATSSFAIVLALFQFETTSLAWLSFSKIATLCFIVASIWSVLLHEIGLRWDVAVLVSFGGWVFCMLNISQLQNVIILVAPEEHVFATLFILFPQAILCLQWMSSSRKPSVGKSGNNNGHANNVV